MHYFKFNIVVLCLLILQSCVCNKHNTNSGIIESDFNFTNGYANPVECLTMADTLCIRDDSTYKNLFKIDYYNPNCKFLHLPTIDFDKNSILVFNANLRGNLYYHRDVNVDSIHKIVTYQIKVSNCFCYDVCESPDLNIVIVPRIDKTYKVIYKYK